MNTFTDEVELITTSGVIALMNLNVQIDNLERGAPGRLAAAQVSDLIDLLLLRGQILGRIADYERATTLAEQLMDHASTDASAFLARARTRATLHRFEEALADLDEARRRGLDPVVVDAECVAIFQALGRYNEALALCRHAVARQPDFATLGALAGLLAERKEIMAAEWLFSEARRRYQGVSPFPIALLDFQRGLMWLTQGALYTARIWFAAAQRRVPAYVPALGHLAEVDAALGERAAAISRLQPLTACSDDPEYAALLAKLLHEDGQSQAARQWCSKAAARYDELTTHHPAAFADHAAEFWLTTGGDVKKAVQLARQNLAIRQTRRAYALLRRAALASAGGRNVRLQDRRCRTKLPSKSDAVSLIPNS